MDIAADLESLWHAHHRRLAQYIAYRVDVDHVDDILQEVYLRSFLALQRGVIPEKPLIWLYRIAHNLVVDEYRRRAHAPAVMEIDTVSVEDGVERSLTYQCVQHAISQLRDDQGYVVQRRMQGYEYGEIGAQLGKTNGAAKQLNTRAFANLRTALQEAL